MQFVLQNVCGFFAIHRTTVIMIICHLFLFLSFFLSFFLVWQEVFDNHDKLKPDTIVEVWKGGEPQYGPELAAVIQQSQKTHLLRIYKICRYSFRSQRPVTAPSSLHRGTSTTSAMAPTGSSTTRLTRIISPERRPRRSLSSEER